MNTVTEQELHALIDGQLPPGRRDEVLAWLAQHPADAAWVEQMRRQRAALRGIESEVLAEPVPQRLLDAIGAPGVVESPGSARAAPPVWRFALAASILALGWVLGWLSHGRLADPGSLARRDPAPRFVQDAAIAHALFAPEVRHPVEVGSEQQDHLVQWLSKRLGKPLKAPRLDARGFSLMGGRLLPAESGANAQFMYQNAGGERITLYVTVLAAGTAPAPTAFRFVGEGEASSFYWLDRDFGYALTSRLGREPLLAIAKEVYAQTSE